MPDVGRHEVASRIGVHEEIACAGRRGAPERDTVVVVVVGKRGEASLATVEPGRLAVTEPLFDLGPRETQAPHSFEDRAGR
jgi:hypothetical protein